MRRRLRASTYSAQLPIIIRMTFNIKKKVVQTSTFATRYLRRATRIQPAESGATSLNIATMMGGAPCKLSLSYRADGRKFAFPDVE